MQHDAVTMTEPRRLPRLSNAAPFLTTRWTRVCLAKADSEDGTRGRWRDLCEAYYEPVVAFPAPCVLRDADAARETSHAFFAEELLAGGRIGTAAARVRGRFRSYLLGAAKHFVGTPARGGEPAMKRGGGRQA
jgi:hypothetical protein